MGRVDYVNEGRAPAANSVVPSVVAIVQDDQGRVLMIHKTDNGKWPYPAAVTRSASRSRTPWSEVKEETGYDVEVETITGTYTDPGHVMAYDDGEVRQQFPLAFRAKLTGGEPQTSNESDRVEWVAPDQLNDLDLHPSMRLRIAHALTGNDRPVIG